MRVRRLCAKSFSLGYHLVFGMFLLQSFPVRAATDITISTGPTAGGTFIGSVFTLPGNPATANVNNVEIQNLLNASPIVIIDTASAAANPGDITVTASIAKTGGGTSALFLRAANTITLTGGSDITSASNQLSVTLNSDRDADGDGAIGLGAGSVVSSNGGDLVLGGGSNPLATAAQGTASQPNGVQLNGAQLVSGAGAISLRGRGHDDPALATHQGIQLLGGSVVDSTSGNVTLDGTGGAGTSANIGVHIGGTGSQVSSVSGAIQITGRGGAGTAIDNCGIALRNGGVIRSTGTGAGAANLVVEGTAGAGTSQNFGVVVSGTGSLLTSVDRTVTVTGTGSGTGAENDGVRIAGGGIETTGTAALTVTGNGTLTGGGSGRGVRLFSPGTVRGPATGNVTLGGSGTGGNADLEWDTLAITKTGGTYTFNDTVLGTSTFTANAGDYNVTFDDGGTINGAVTLNDTGTVTLGGTGDTFTFGSLAGTVAATAVTLNAASLTVGNSNDTSFAGSLGGTGALNKQGTGTLGLSNPNSSLSGALTIHQGSIEATAGHNDTNATSALGNPAIARNITVNAGASLRFSAHDVFGNFASSLAATLVVNGGTVTSTGNFFNSLGPLQLNGGTLFAMGGANPGFQAYNLLGNVTIGGAAASVISSSGSNRGIHLNTSTQFLVADVTGNPLADLIISAPLLNRTAGQGGAGALVKTGAGKATLA